MFDADVYIERRHQLKQQMKSGLILFLGNEDSPMNYPDNTYHFRQDSSFLYFWGLDSPGLAAAIDVESDREVIYGDDPTIDEIVWLGSQMPLSAKSRNVGIKETATSDKLGANLGKAIQQGKKIHFLPQYRAKNKMKLGNMLDIHPSKINDNASTQLIKSVIAQRSIKSNEEIAEIEAALDVTYEMHTMAMRESKPGKYEREIAGAMEGIALSNDMQVAYPIIFSTDGQTLHNHYHGNVMKAGDIIVNDSGAESLMRYASDITRTIPVGGKFSERQKEIYQIVLDAQVRAIEAVKPGVTNKDVHLLACKIMTRGLKELGLMKGDVDEAVEAGAHAIFFQCGNGHMMGLDVHDMENLGEDLVGYTEEIRRSDQFGLSYLRLAKALEPGFVITIEPGVYIIPELIDRWQGEKRFNQYINYDMFEKYKDFGGVRIEDDILVVKNGSRILGKPIPKTIEDVEELASS